MESKEHEAFESVFTAENGWDLTCINGCYQNIGTFKAFAGWQAAKEHAIPEGFVLVPKVLPSEINDQVWDDYLTPQCVVNEDGFSFISCEDFDLDALYQTLLKAQEQSHDSQNT